MPRILLLVLLVAVLILPGCSNGRKGCVSWGSMVDTPGGQVRAEEIQIGDLVTTLTPDGTLGIGRVTATRQAKAHGLLSISLQDGRALWVTRDHPIGVSDIEFVPAGQLAIGDRVRTGDADSPIVSISRRRSKYRVIDLTVEPDENFFANGVLVHNKRLPPRPPTPTMPGRYVSIGTHTTIELTENGGRVFIPRPDGADHLPRGDSVWDIGPWTLDEYTMTAPLTRRDAEDWLSLAIAEDTAVLVIRAIGTRPRHLPAGGPPNRAVLQSVRIETPTRVQGLGSGWTTPDAIEKALRGFAPESP